MRLVMRPYIRRAPLQWVLAIFVCLLVLASPPIWGETIGFEVREHSAGMDLQARGDEIVYVPRVFALDVQGQWINLIAETGLLQIAPAQSARFVWPQQHAPQHPARIYLVYFMDRAGFDYGEVAMPTPWPGGQQATLSWHQQHLLLKAPPSVQTTWIIRPELSQSTHMPVSALPIAWNALPAITPDAWFDLRTVPQERILLLHEMRTPSPTPYTLQWVEPRVKPDRSLRPLWLRTGYWGYWLGAGLLGLAALLGYLGRTKKAAAMAEFNGNLAQPTMAPPSHAWLWHWAQDIVVLLLFAILTGSILHPLLLSTADLPTGGDMASHVLYAQIFHTNIAPQGHLTAWLPEVFGGYPLFSYYFPLPFIVASGLGHCIGFAPGLKWAMVLPALLLPGTVFIMSRRVLRLGSIPAFTGALGSWAFLLHEQHSIWGGNLLSLLAGEFAYSWGLWLSFCTLVVWMRALHDGKAWIWAAALEALTGLSHGYPLLVTAFGSWILFFVAKHKLRMAWDLLRGHALAFCLLAGWLWPLLEMHNLTVPNSTSAAMPNWRDMLPETMWSVWIAGLLGGTLLALSQKHSSSSSTRYITTAAFGGLCALTVLLLGVGADRVGLLAIRFFPAAWLWGAICAGWLAGTALERYYRKLHPAYLAAAALSAQMAWLQPLVQQAPQWAYWNFSGPDHKPQWSNLKTLFPYMQGSWESPRLLFEHDPANGDIGSTRALETLPIYIGGRPVLEGLYMESALLAPAIYQLQSEISARPSSPLANYPSGVMNADMAILHMNMLHANQILLRSAQAKSLFSNDNRFRTVAQAPPFVLLQLKTFNSHLVDTSAHPWKIAPSKNWMDNSYRWFRSRTRSASEWPVYIDNPPHAIRTSLNTKYPSIHISEFKIDRESIAFRTDTPGAPHLLKIAYHPRWQLKTKGQLVLAAPGYMLIIPAEQVVRLEYGVTLIGKAGQIVSAITLLALAVFIATFPAHPRRNNTLACHAFLSALLFMGLTYILYQLSPGTIYARGWKEMQSEKYEHAAKSFYKAYLERKSTAGREEALFWSAKALEKSGHLEEAALRYRELFSQYEGYWAPESMHAYAHIEQQLGNSHQNQWALRALREKFPDSKFSKINQIDPAE